MSNDQFTGMILLLAAAVGFGWWQGHSNATEAHERIIRYMTPACRAALEKAVDTMNWVDEGDRRRGE